MYRNVFPFGLGGRRRRQQQPKKIAVIAEETEWLFTGLSVFTFHSLPSLYLLIYSVVLFFLSLLLGVHNWREAFKSWPLGSRMTRSSSINNGRSTTNRPPYSLISFPPMIPLALFSFIQNAACNDNTTFFRSRGRSVPPRRKPEREREKDDGDWERERAWESSSLGDGGLSNIEKDIKNRRKGRMVIREGGKETGGLTVWCD